MVFRVDSYTFPETKVSQVTASRFRGRTSSISCLVLSLRNADSWLLRAPATELTSSKTADGRSTTPTRVTNLKFPSSLRPSRCSRSCVATFEPGGLRAFPKQTKENRTRPCRTRVDHVRRVWSCGHDERTGPLALYEETNATRKVGCTQRRGQQRADIRGGQGGAFLASPCHRRDVERKFLLRSRWREKLAITLNKSRALSPASSVGTSRACVGPCSVYGSCKAGLPHTSARVRPPRQRCVRETVQGSPALCNR